MRIALLFLICLLVHSVSFAQIFKKEQPVYNADSVRAVLENAPYFTLFKDNYFICGTSLGQSPTKTNSDVKFQLSVMQRLTKSRLPFDTYLFLQYTQKTFWNVFEKSLPIYDLNFNPGLGLGRLFVHKNKYIGRGYLLIEHESNGKDSTDSRSWNKISLGGNFILNRNFNLHGKIWYPIIDGRNNKDILKYTGLFQIGSDWHSNNERFHISTLFTKRKTWRFSFNTQLEVSYKISRKENQYLFVQYYNGYGEGLLDYNWYNNKIRLGFVIKPRDDFSIY